ncbi:MAG: response regulator [Burkholderiaceae bacterium]
MPTAPILIVDDSASFRTVARMALERAGYRVIEANDGAAALRHLDGPPLLCIVSDVNMPHMDGVAFVEQVKAHARQRFVPIVMFSTEANLRKMSRCREAGVRAWLSKPFHSDVLVDAVRKLAGPPGTHPTGPLP